MAGSTPSSEPPVTLAENPRLRRAANFFWLVLGVAMLWFTENYIFTAVGVFWVVAGAAALLPALPFRESRLATRLFSAALIFGLGFAIYLEFSRSFSRATSPVPPEFNDVSAFKDGDVASIDAWLREQVALAEYPSLSVAVVRDGAIVYQRAFGLEDISAGRKATPETSYHVASVTKAFTATLAVMLHDRGVIDLDQPVVTYLPTGVSISTKPELGATITLRQLASHTSGLPRAVPGRVQTVEGRYQLEPERLYELLADVDLSSMPGTNEEYSNLGFGLLGHALERAAGKPYEQLLKEMVCDPLSLERTTTEVHETLRLATGYNSAIPRREEEYSYRERLVGSGGLVATAPDLARFLAMQMEPGVLTEEMLQQLHTPTKLVSGRESGTALGWSVVWNVYVGQVLEKNGGRSNCGAWIGFSPEHKVGVAVVTNCGDPSVDAIGEWLLERSVPGGRKLVTKYGYAKVAPYAGIRWEDDRPIVLVRDHWSPLVSIDSIPVGRIMEFAQKEFGARAKKRFAEDLVELLSKMGHELDWDVTLGLETRDGEVEYLQVRMTEANRELVRE